MDTRQYIGISQEDYEESQSGVTGISDDRFSRGIDMDEAVGQTLISGIPTAAVKGPEIPEEERAFAIAHPNVYAARETFFDMLGSIKRAYNPLEEQHWDAIGSTVRRAVAPTSQELEESLYALNAHIPWFKFINPEVRENFMELDLQHQVRALLLDDLEATTFGIGRVFAALGKGIAETVGPVVRALGAGAKALKPVYKFKPIEDLVHKGVRPFIEEQAIFGKLKKAGWKDGEIGAALESDNLYGYLRENTGKVSDAFAEAIDWSTGMPRLGTKIKELMKSDTLRQVHYQKEWRSAFQKRALEETKHMKEVSINLAKDAFDAQITKAFGEEVAGKISLNNAPDVVMANFARDIQKGSKIVHNIIKGGQYNKLFWDSFSPVRVVLGAWDKAYGTFKNVYQKVSPGLELRNQYIVDKNLVLFQMYKDRGLGTFHWKPTGELVFDHSFSPAELKKAYEVLLEMDNLAEIGRRSPALQQAMRRKAKDLGRSLSPTGQKLVKTWNDFSDHLFAEHVAEKIPQLFEAKGLTAMGRRELGSMLDGANVTLAKTFDKLSGLSYEQKQNTIKKLLDEFKAALGHPLVKKEGTHPWFDATGNELRKVIKDLSVDLTQGKGGKFVGYLENYAARVGQAGNRMKEGWDTALLGRMHPFYEKGRKAVTSLDVVEDFGSMMEVRVRAQANELYLYPKIDEAVKHAQGLPAQVREYVDHYISRILGRQSLADTKLANFMQRMPKVLGGGTYWTEEKIATLGRRLNDLCIMGGLGYKPFAVMRDLFQPLLTVPADLGGLKGFAHLLKGYKRAMFDPKFRTWIKDIGAIQEYAPELYLKQRIFSFGKGARWDQVRDSALWMYGYTDRFNRYTAGGAALNKWEAAVNKIGLDRLLTERGRKEFSKKVFGGRYPWVKDQLDDLLRMGKIEEAKATWVKDVIADTQYLYRPAESPIASQKFGTLGRTGFLFQSWWMNYGNLLEKWMRTGDAGATANRMFTWMVSSASAATMMEGAWGQGTALRTTFLGPFPTTFDKTLIPAAWTPIYETVHALAWGIPTRVWEGRPDKLEEHAKSLIRSLAILVPGGLQMKQIFQSVKKEGLAKGLPQSILRYQRARNWKPMPVRAAKWVERRLR